MGSLGTYTSHRTTYNGVIQVFLALEMQVLIVSKMNLLFVCQGNSFRSIIAQALADKHLPDSESRSAGLDPYRKVREITRQALEQVDAYNPVKGEEPKPVTRELLEWADKIVVMEEYQKQEIIDDFDIDETSIDVWGVEDLPPIEGEVEKIPEGVVEILEDIERKIRNLI